MDVHDGFIVGIYNYCDRWCEVCALTSRCRSFAEQAEYDAEQDPQLRAIVEAPPIPEETPAPLPRWVQEMFDALNEAARQPISDEELERMLPTVLPAHMAIDACARSLCFRVVDYCRQRGIHDRHDPADPWTVIRWFALFIAPKVHRALTGLAEVAGGEDLGPPYDHDGSAKAALIGIDKSMSAWVDIAEQGGCPANDAVRFIEELSWLRDRLESVFPDARAFVRPGLDEPEEVAKLMASE